MAMKGAAKLRPLAKTPGAQFEISIDGTPRTYRDRKAFAIEAAERLKRKHPNSDIVVKDLQSGEVIALPSPQCEDLCGLPLARDRSHDAVGPRVSPATGCEMPAPAGQTDKAVATGPPTSWEGRPVPSREPVRGGQAARLLGF